MENHERVQLSQPSWGGKLVKDWIFFSQPSSVEIRKTLYIYRMWIELPSVSTFQEFMVSVFAGDFGTAAETPAETRNLSFQSQRHARLLSWACGGSGHGMMHHLQQVLSLPWLINTEAALQGEAGFTADTAELSQSCPPAALNPSPWCSEFSSSS